MEQTVRKNYFNNRIHPHKFALWLSMASIMMMFGAFTSAYLVRQGAGNWLDFNLPPIFFINTAVIIANSICLHFALKSFKKKNFGMHKVLVLVSFALGITFVTLQYMGWQQLFASGIDLKGNPSGSFLYVITGVHAAHIIGGLAATLVALIHIFTLPKKLTMKRLVRFELVVQYWHFVDLLWVYLLIFLLISK